MSGIPVNFTIQDFPTIIAHDQDGYIVWSMCPENEYSQAIYKVRYGFQVKDFDNVKDAFKEYEACVSHAEACCLDYL